MADGTDRLGRLLDDLHKLEINTIEKPNLTATKMPAPLLAIHQIYDAYKSLIDTPFGENAVHTDADEGHPPTSGELQYLFDEMTGEANAIKNMMRDSPDPVIKSRRVIIARIASSCTVLKGILQRDTNTMTDNISSATAEVLRGMDRLVLDDAWQISQSDRAQIRKIWEVGTESVLIQTVIQIEGDVITRMNSAIAQNHHPEIMAVHQQGIETALRTWGNLITTAQNLVGSLFRVATGSSDR